MHAAVRPLSDLRQADKDSVEQIRVRLMVPDMPCAAELQPYLEQIDQRGWYTNFGPLVRTFEAGLAAILTRHSGAEVFVTTTSSGTTALDVGLAAFQLKPKARVLLPSLTFPGTASAVVRAGCVPVLTDVDRHSWLLTPSMARGVLEQTRIDAVVPVATYGAPQSAAGWDKFMQETGCPVLIDAAGAFGEQKVGKFATTAFSLHATKALGVGEGGLLASRCRNFADRARCWSNFGYEDGLCEGPGTNAKMSEYHAAVGLAQIARWPELQIRRRRTWATYRRALARQAGDQVIRQRRPRPVAPTLMMLQLPVEAALVARRLRAKGVETRRWYCPPLHRQPAFAAVERVNVAGEPDLAVAETLGRGLLGLPFHTGLDEQAIDRVCVALLEAIGELR